MKHKANVKRFFWTLNKIVGEHVMVSHKFIWFMVHHFILHPPSLISSSFPNSLLQPSSLAHCVILSEVIVGNDNFFFFFRFQILSLGLGQEKTKTFLKDVSMCDNIVRCWKNDYGCTQSFWRRREKKKCLVPDQRFVALSWRCCQGEKMYDMLAY